MHPLKGTDHNYADVLSMSWVTASASVCHELQFSPVIRLQRCSVTVMAVDWSSRNQCAADCGSVKSRPELQVSAGRFNLGDATGKTTFLPLAPTLRGTPSL